MPESPCCSTSLPVFGVASVLHSDHSNRCVVVSHCCFNLQFLDNMMLICYLCIFFGEVSVKGFDSFFYIKLLVFLLFNFRSSLYILNNRRVFYQHFLPVGGLSYCLDIVLCRPEEFHFNEVLLINCFFHRLCLWHCNQKIITTPKIT